MRVTNSMMTNRMMLNVNRSMTNLDKLYTQYASGKRINRPSDDPILASRALKFRTNVTETKQYQRNTDQAMSWMNVTESAFNNTYNILKKIRDVCVDGSSDVPLTSTDRQELIAEIEQLMKQIGSEMNVTYSGRYVFSGYRTDQPYTLTADQPSASYSIFQTFSASDIQYTKSYRKLDETGVPDVKDVAILKLPYTDMGSVTIPGYTVNTVSYYSKTSDPYSPADGTINYIPETGELVLAGDVAKNFPSSGTSASATLTLTIPTAPNPTDPAYGTLDPDFLAAWNLYTNSNPATPGLLETYQKKLEEYTKISDEYEANYKAAYAEYEKAMATYNKLYSDWEKLYSDNQKEIADYDARLAKWIEYNNDKASYDDLKSKWDEYNNYTAWQQYRKDEADYDALETAWNAWNAWDAIPSNPDPEPQKPTEALPANPPTQPTTGLEPSAAVNKPTTSLPSQEPQKPDNDTAPNPDGSGRPPALAASEAPKEPEPPANNKPQAPVAPVPPDPEKVMDYAVYANDYTDYLSNNYTDYTDYLTEFKNYYKAGGTYATYVAGYNGAYKSAYTGYLTDVEANTHTPDGPPLSPLAKIKPADAASIENGPAYGVGTYTVTDEKAFKSFITDYNTYLAQLASFEQDAENYLGLSEQYAAFVKTNGNAFAVQYTKNGLEKGDLNPLAVFNCRDLNDNNKIYTMDDQKLEYIVGVNTTIQVNSLGKDVYTENLYADLMNFCEFVSSISFSNEDQLIQKYSALPYEYSGDKLTQAVKDQQTLEEQKARSALQDRFSDMLDLLDRHTNKVSTEQSNLGARMNRVELISERLQEDESSYEELLSKTEDADVVEVIMNLQIASSVYQAALQAGAKIIQMSLADYVR